MKTIINHKAKLIAGGVALFALVAIFIVCGSISGTPKAQACDQQGCNPPCDQDCLPNLTGYCQVSVSEAEIGDSVTWSGFGQGGSGAYIYTWSGDDGLSSWERVVTKSYSTSGTKNATVVIESNGQSVTKTCTVFIRPARQEENLDGRCEGRPSTVDEDERVTWTAFPTGGDGSYEYDWSGDDGLNGDEKSITKRYDDSGTKEATVRITSNGRSITRSCDIRVRKEDNNNDDLDASCVANPSTVDINERVTYTAHPSGISDGSYRYSWSGTDGLDGSGKTVSHSYSTSGSKNATVRVTVRGGDNDGDEVTATCHATVREQDVIYVPPQYVPPQTGVYLDTIPATGLSPSVKTALFLSGTLIWSAFLGYLFIRRRNLKLQEQRMIDEALNG